MGRGEATERVYRREQSSRVWVQGSMNSSAMAGWSTYMQQTWRDVLPGPRVGPDPTLGPTMQAASWTTLKTARQAAPACSPHLCQQGGNDAPCIDQAGYTQVLDARLAVDGGACKNSLSAPATAAHASCAAQPPAATCAAG